MKELSIEDKAKRYDEALGKARRYYDEYKTRDNILYVEDMEDMFPELKESEDEIIRKVLLAYFKNELKKHGNEEWDWCIHTTDVIAWLEKQGEQNYKIIKGKNYFCVKTHNYAGVEWIKDIKYYASDNYTLVNQGCEYYCPKYSKEEHNNLFKEVKFDGCVEKQGEQKPAENVDLPEFESHLCLMFQKFRTKGMCTNGEIIDYVKEHSQKLRDILVNPAWSEENKKLWVHDDDILLDAAKMIVEDSPRKSYGGVHKKEIVPWFYSLKERLKSLRSQNTWRPSDFQLKSLQVAIGIIGEQTLTGTDLKELLEQLEKLMEEDV